MAFVLNLVCEDRLQSPFWLKRTNIERVPRRNDSLRLALACSERLPVRVPPSFSWSSEGPGFCLLLAQLLGTAPMLPALPLLREAVRGWPAFTQPRPLLSWSFGRAGGLACLLAQLPSCFNSQRALWPALDLCVGLITQSLTRPRPHSSVSGMPLKRAGATRCDASPAAQAAAQRNTRQEAAGIVGQQKAGPALFNSGGNAQAQ